VQRNQVPSESRVSQAKTGFSKKRRIHTSTVHGPLETRIRLLGYRINGVSWLGLVRLVPCARLAFVSLVLEAAHVLTFRDSLQSAALLPLFRPAGQALQDYTSMSL
jgi:hypothetical protein